MYDFDIKEKIILCTSFIEKYKSHQTCCRICPRNCGIDRTRELGECGEPFLPRVASVNLHKGEEPPISGSRGSGTIFFAGCNLHCVFCQNYPISQQHNAGMELDISGLAQKMLDLQDRGAHNINLVTPSHEILAIVMALKMAYEKGLTLPIVYNTSAFDLSTVVRDLEGIIDIYLPDAKYSDPGLAEKYSDALAYVKVNRETLKEMYRQKGSRLYLDTEGIAQSGMIIRHLLLPGQLENSRQVLKWISQELSPHIHISIMSQYFPAYKASSDITFKEINHNVGMSEYEELLEFGDSLDLHNGWWQDPESTGGA